LKVQPKIGKISSMEHRILGKTGLKVSVIGLGTLYITTDRLPDTEQAIEVINKSLDLGINYIDTAVSYPGTEERIGQVLKHRKNECYILSRSAARDPYQFAKDIDTSLTNLQVDCIDIYQLHDVTRPGVFETLMKKGGCYDELIKAVSQEKIKHAGISTHGDPGHTEQIILTDAFEVITMSYNLIGYKRGFNEDSENNDATGKKLIPLAKQHGLGITIMKPAAGGLIDKMVLPALKLLVANPDISVITPGMKSIEEVTENVQAGDHKNLLTEKEQRELFNELQKYAKDTCRACGYCLPCSQKIEIPKILRALTKYKISPDKEINLVKRIVKELKVQPTECTECDECEKKCPYQIPITNKLKESSKIFQNLLDNN
jgi:hypothetical protein